MIGAEQLALQRKSVQDQRLGTNIFNLGQSLSFLLNSCYYDHKSRN